MNVSDGLKRKIETSVERLRTFEPEEGYYLAFSGGKDSVVIKALADMAGVKYDAHYNVTSVDPPELVQFIKQQHPDVAFDIPHDADGKPVTMWSLILKKMVLPTPHRRFCCEYLKEQSGIGRLTVTGVRWAESVRRSSNQGIITTNASIEDGAFERCQKGNYVLMNDNASARRTVETCYRKRKTLVNPIVDWTTTDVWQFIRAFDVPYCGLYDQGEPRLGCIGCQMASRKKRWHDFIRWPKYANAYRATINKMLVLRRERGLETPWKTVGEVMDWWMKNPNIDGQTSLFGEEEEP